VAELDAMDGRPAELAELGEAISRASLLGARGNSGVILSQVLRGMFERLPGGPETSPADLATALAHAWEEAHHAVAKPRDGTVLSVLRDSAAAATRAAGGGSALPDVVEAALEEARRSLDRTRTILPELRAAGVVDAGAKGFVLLLDALGAAVEGRTLSEPVGPPGPVGSGDGGGVAPEATHEFEVQFLLEAGSSEVGAFRRELGEIGDSIVMVGGGGLYQVHVHTDLPDDAVAAGRRAGTVRETSKVSLRDQVTACIGGQARGVQVAEQVCGLVAVASGEGLAQAFRSLGAVVVRGEPEENPSVRELVAAIEAAPGEGVLVLPNHPNVVPAAERAALAASKEAVVVDTGSVPAGLAAATAFNPVEGLGENVAAAGQAARAVRAGEVAQAEGDAAAPAGDVRQGDWLGLAGGQVVVIEGSPGAALAKLAERLAGGDPGPEIVTVVAGEDTPGPEAEATVERLRALLPGAEVELLRGGQPRYRYLIGVE